MKAENIKSEITRIPSANIVPHLSVAIDVYKDDIKALKRNPTGIGATWLIAQFGAQIKECELYIQHCEEHDVVEFVLTE